MRKAFLRAPLDFTRISSRFDPKRLHPVFKLSAHIEALITQPPGTPVYAAGDGRVQDGYSKANGNYVFIKHGVLRKSTSTCTNARCPKASVFASGKRFSWSAQPATQRDHTCITSF